MSIASEATSVKWAHSSPWSGRGSRKENEWEAQQMVRVLFLVLVGGSRDFRGSGEDPIRRVRRGEGSRLVLPICLPAR